MCKKLCWVLVSLTAVFALGLAGCGGGGQPSASPTAKAGEAATTSTSVEPAAGTAWKYEASISDPIEVTSGEAAVTLADPAGSIRITVPGQAFDGPTRLTLKNPASVPPVVLSEFTPIGAPVEITGAEKRLNGPAVVSFRVDPQQYAQELKDGAIWITYYDGQRWEYFPPDSVDLVQGIVSFETYHFSLFGHGKISEEERLAHYAHKQAVLRFSQQSSGQLVQGLARSASEALAKKLGLDPKSVSGIVLLQLTDAGNYIDMADQLNRGEYAQFAKTLSQAISEKLLEAGMLTVSNTVPQAALAKLVEVEAKLVQHGMDSWRQEEVEAAYQVYKDGASGGGRGFWGYFMNTGDFDDLWTQMKGVSRQLEAEAIAAEKAQRELLGQPEPTEEELEAIRERAKADLKAQFDLRAKNEDQIAKNEMRIRALIAEFQKGKLLEKWSFDYDPDAFSEERRLDQLFELTDKIMRDTGRGQWIEGALSTEKEISAGDLVSLMQAWYAGPEEYAKELEQRFGISLQPTATPQPTAGPTTAPQCDGYYELWSEEVPLWNCSSSQWENDGILYLYLSFQNGVISAAPSAGGGEGEENVPEANGTYDSSGNVNVTFTDGWVVNGSFAGKFVESPRSDIGCFVRGTLTGVVRQYETEPVLCSPYDQQTNFTAPMTTWDYKP